MSEFFGQNFTLMAKIMVQYPLAYTGPIFAASNGGFELSKRDDNNHLVARFGGTTVTYSLGPLQAGTWHHIALVRLQSLFFLYVDGLPICPDGFGGCSIQAAPASGVLRFGRAGPNAISGSAENQHYGFIDDVGVFNVALSQSTIQSLMSKARMDGGESGLYAGYTFDDQTPSKQPLPAVLNRPVTYMRVTPTGDVVNPFPFGAIVSQARDSSMDRNFQPFPNNQVLLKLPFPSGEAWRVSQGWQGSISHSGRAAFAWDFVLAGQATSATEGKAFYAAAAGPVEEVEDNRDSCVGYPANHVDVEHTTDEYGVYLHHVEGSAAVGMGQNVSTGTYLADAGDTGNSCCNCFHLHFALHNFPESMAGFLVTIPATFENYEVSTDSGQTWTAVVKGVPQQDEWVRNP